jgi:hypothetical protein
MRAVVLFVALGFAGVGRAAAAAPALPDDARLASVRAHLEQVVQKASAAGLPIDMIIGKVREGLAKGVDAGRIDTAAQRVADNLGEAQQMVTSHRGSAPPGLVRAVAEARMANVPAADVDALVRGDRPEPPTRRAVEVLTDLSLRGYPTGRAVAVVRAVLARDAGSLDKVPGTLETIRVDFALTQGEAADALARGFSAASSLQAAAGRAAEDERSRGNGRGRDRSDDRDSPGRSGSAPGHLPKVNPATGASPPGQGKRR